MMGWYGNGASVGDWVVMVLVMLPLWLALIALTVWLIRSMATDRYAVTAPSAAPRAGVGTAAQTPPDADARIRDLERQVAELRAGTGR